MSKLPLLLPLLLLAAVARNRSAPSGDPRQARGQDREQAAAISQVSRALVEYTPPRGAEPTAASMAAAAQAFLASLSDELRVQACFALDDAERRRWTNVPPGRDEGGVRLGDCDAAQVQRALDLLAATLSEQGYQKVRRILLADDRLLRGGQPRQGFGAVNFWLAIFGEPSATAPWGLQLDGHHLALNLSFHGERMTMSPSFLGTQPSRYMLGDEQVVPLAAEVERAHALVAALSEEQRAKAVVSPRRGRNLAAAGKDGFVPEPAGLSCASLDDAQRTLLRALIGSVVGDLPGPHAKRQMATLDAQIDAMHFAWSGPIEAGSDMSYRVQGPKLILEFAGQDLGGDPLDHLHVMYRDPSNEYGAALAD